MHLEFLTDEFVPEPHVRRMAEELFLKAALDIGLPAEELADVLIADDANYPRAVERIAPGGCFTQHPSGTRGMAKTNTVRESTGNLSHKLVVHLNVLGGAISSIFDQTDPEPERAALKQLCFYTLYHELGHCRDNRTRPDRPFLHICLPGKGFEIGQITRYYADILEEEYAACVLAAPWMSPAAYRYSVGAILEDITFFRSESGRLTTEYAADRSSLSDVAATVAGLAWFQLIQFAKTAASRMGNDALATFQLDRWPDPGDDMINALVTEFEINLATHWTIYPNWASEPEAFLRQTWEEFTLLLGFKFVEDDPGSAIYW